MDANRPTCPDPKSRVNISGGTINARDIVGGNLNITNNFFTDPVQARNRRDMLELVTNTWIKGVLEQSLYNQVLIELGLQTQPGAVERSWDLHLQMPEQPAVGLPQGTPIIEVFDQCNGAMLILGEPGAGKTTLLLQLARDLISRTVQDPLMRIPVVLNISSWSDPKGTIADWLVLALNTQYRVPKKLAQTWVEQDALLLLLDGLDEVKLEGRDACVKAINAFRGEHGIMPLVVCSRIADYQALTQRLELRGAVLIQPLTSAQIDSYLDRAGPELAVTRFAITQDPALRELVEQPLMLSIMTLAYRGVAASDLGSELSGTVESRRKHLFDIYIGQMFRRVARTKNEPYDAEQAKHWLNWLAERMMEHGQSVFFIESLARSWMPAHARDSLARLIFAPVRGLAGGIQLGLFAGLFAAFVAGLFFLPYVALWAGLALALIGGLVGAWAYGLDTGQDVGAMETQVELPNEQLTWSWSRSSDVLFAGLGIGFGICILAALFSALPVVLSNGSIIEVFAGLVPALVAGLVGGLFVALFTGFSAAIQTSRLETRTTPNEGTHKSLVNALFVSAVFGMIFGLGAGLIVGRLAGLAAGVLAGIVAGLAGGLSMGLTTGGLAVLNHYLVRLLLYRNNSMPLNYVRFLDYATERIFLRKVGGGYIFIHRMLMEHFAAMEDATSKDSRQSQ